MYSMDMALNTSNIAPAPSITDLTDKEIATAEKHFGIQLSYENQAWRAVDIDNYDYADDSVHTGYGSGETQEEALEAMIQSLKGMDVNYYVKRINKVMPSPWHPEMMWDHTVNMTVVAYRSKSADGIRRGWVLRSVLKLAAAIGHEGLEENARAKAEAEAMKAEVQR